MHEEVNEKTISLAIKGGKISASILKVALTKLLSEMGKAGKQAVQKSKSQRETVSHGKQSLKKLTQQGSQLTNIEITDKNIKSFDRVARKYGIDYSLKKDASTEPPRYLVFFKARDVDVMTAAFREYTGVSMKKTKKTSIRKKLQIARDRVAKQRERTKTRDKEKEPER
ncbi:MAG: PcfB family protein [Lachnospiraceae bacterium]|nr:PcfB family protein [Lachnospiraceae bacterium]